MANLKLQEWLDYIQRIHFSAIDLGLERVLPLARALEVTRFDCPVITVGGTNGKGSVVETLQQIYRAAGYRVATYTSPHLLFFNERLCINGIVLPDAVWVRAFEVIEAARGNSSLSFFEFTTLAALWICRQQTLDVLILEVGLGGRLDAVNSVDASVAVVTNVDIDHVDWLGDSREKIGFEKAGIFRFGGRAVCGDPSPPEALLEVARKHRVALFCYRKDYHVVSHASHWDWIGPQKSYYGLPPPQLRLQNVATAVMAQALLDLPTTEVAIRTGVQQAKLPGRYESIELCCKVIFDVAHNPQATRALLERFLNENNQGRCFVVVGMLRDKDICGALLPWVHTVDTWYLASLPVERAAKATELAAILTENGAESCYNFESVAAAFETALENSEPHDVILVFGSFYTIAEAKRFLMTASSKFECV